MAKINDYNSNLQKANSTFGGNSSGATTSRPPFPSGTPVPPLTITSTPFGTTQINISWTASSNLAGPLFQLYRSTATDCASCAFPTGTSPIFQGLAYSYADTNVTAGVTYCYYVTVTYTPPPPRPGFPSAPVTSAPISTCSVINVTTGDVLLINSVDQFLINLSNDKINL
jgi:hypothetical protein